MVKLPPKNTVPFATFSNETKETVLTREGHRCVCGCSKCDGVVHSIHHIIPNTKPNRKNYGNLLQRRENGIALCLQCHGHCVFRFKELQREVQAVFDALISENPDIINASGEEIEIALNKYKKIIGEVNNGH